MLIISISLTKIIKIQQEKRVKGYINKIFLSSLYSGLFLVFFKIMFITYISYRKTIMNGSYIYVNLKIFPTKPKSGIAQSVFTFGPYGVYPTNIRTLRLYSNYLLTL